MFFSSDATSPVGKIVEYEAAPSRDVYAENNPPVCYSQLVTELFDNCIVESRQIARVA